MDEGAALGDEAEVPVGPRVPATVVGDEVEVAEMTHAVGVAEVAVGRASVAVLSDEVQLAEMVHGVGVAGRG